MFSEPVTVLIHSVNLWLGSGSSSVPINAKHSLSHCCKKPNSKTIFLILSYQYIESTSPVNDSLHYKGPIQSSSNDDTLFKSTSLAFCFPYDAVVLTHRAAVVVFILLCRHNMSWTKVQLLQNHDAGNNCSTANNRDNTHYFCNKLCFVVIKTVCFVLIICSWTICLGLSDLYIPWCCSVR